MRQLIVQEPVNNGPHEDTLGSIKSYQNSNFGFSLWQTVSTIGALLISYVILYLGVSHGHILVLLLAPLASGLAVRTFILQHDCSHGSLFKCSWMNNCVGRLCSLLTFTPYDHWKKHHSIHHGGWNNIDSRGRISDFYSDCITVAEYKSMGLNKRFFYRLSKNPIISIFVMPPIIFFLIYRIAFDTPAAWLRERLGVYLTNLTLVVCYAGLGHVDKRSIRSA
ncbi:hypothetical protein HKD27_16245 [Gluconobacter sp. R75690]|uniref:fatty acid desaturase n=1 Tax=unclassified Gluconobacter TaxID=2644261 RepID=UPI00188A3B97|nr:hypothetical protein [Gluconobacter sp. R75690]MBF0881116.1 hypothetical protein [Gluconobacter sp. R75828]